MKKLLFRLAGCVGVSNKTAQLIALNLAGGDGKILVRERLHEDAWLIPTIHIFVIQVSSRRVSYVHVQGDCVLQHICVDLPLPQ